MQRAVVLQALGQIRQRFFWFNLWGSLSEFFNRSGKVRFLCNRFRGTPRNRELFLLFPSHTDYGKNSHH